MSKISIGRNVPRLHASCVFAIAYAFAREGWNRRTQRNLRAKWGHGSDPWGKLELGRRMISIHPKGSLPVWIVRLRYRVID